MPYDWSEFLRLARFLMANPPEGISLETVFRCVVSRAYFGAFGHAIRYSVNYLDFSSRSEVDDHGRLPEHLKRRRRAAVSGRLKQLRTWRNCGDYSQDTVQDLELFANNALGAADYVIRALPEPAGGTGS